MSLNNAFNLLISRHSRAMTLSRPGTILSVSILATPSNYSRNLSAPEEVVVGGREYILSKQNLDEAGFPVPKRGDRLTDSELGVNVISEVVEMFNYGAEILGYRVRCS